MRPVKNSQPDMQVLQVANSCIVCLIKWFGATFLLCLSISSNAYTLLFDGGFESGVLQGWMPGQYGTAIVARKGSCFSDQDTQKISIRGQYAGLLRSPDYTSDSNSASLTSKRFTAGSGISFLALSQSKLDLSTPLALNISILDQRGKILETRPLATAQTSLSPGCPSGGSDRQFSPHFISTLPYQGKTIKLRFSQHPDMAAYGGFTLIDSVAVFHSGEAPIDTRLPLAVASATYDSDTQNRYLIAALPAGNIEQTRNWEYSWYIRGETKLRAYYKPCINSLPPGNYFATLYVRDATRLASDSLYFYVGETNHADTHTADSDNCNLAHPLLERVSVPDPAT